MTYIKINDVLIPATIGGRMKDHEWDDRESKSIRLEMTYEEAVSTFIDDLIWSIVYQGEAYEDESGQIITPDPEEYDNSEYSVAGSITDHRDGTVTVKMGKLTDSEALAIITGGVQ